MIAVYNQRKGVSFSKEVDFHTRISLWESQLMYYSCHPRPPFPLANYYIYVAVAIRTISFNVI